MIVPIPKNTFGIDHVKFPFSDECLDFQRLIIGAHDCESRLNLKTKIDVSVTNPDLFKKHADTLENFFEWLTDRHIKFNFIQAKKTPKQGRLGEIHFDFVSSFSGGLDSASYPLILANKNKSGVLHHTHTSPRMLGVARSVYRHCIPRNHKFFVTELNLASTADIPLLHIRGAVFLTNLLCTAKEYDVDQVIVPENGPFMINYPVSMQVAPTRTTDPAMIKSWTDIFNMLTGSKITTKTPFIDKTKSEVILSSQESKLIKFTWSCSTSQGIAKMCGLCMACFVRMLSLYAIDNGEKLDDTYEINPFEIDNRLLKQRKITSFRILLDCLEFWKNIIDPDQAVTSIEKDHYSNLTRRHPVFLNHSLDMYIGLKKFFENQTSSNILGKTAKGYLTKMNNSIVESRQSRLEKQMKIFGWK